MKLRLTRRQMQLVDLALWKMVNEGNKMLTYAAMKGSPVKSEDIPRLEQDLKDLGNIRRETMRLLAEPEE